MQRRPERGSYLDIDSSGAVAPLVRA